MTYRLGIIMDPIEAIHVKKDSSLAMLLAAQGLGWELWYLQPGRLSLQRGRVVGQCQPVTVYDDHEHWYELGNAEHMPLDRLSVVLMRLDPPVDMQYVYITQLLDLVEAAGTLVVNRPSSLRDFNEKLATAWFPECTPPQLVSRHERDFHAFLKQHADIVVKPLDRMGGASVYRITEGDANASVIIEDLTRNGTEFMIAQRYLPEITDGDKRILLIDGEPVPWALARIPAPGELRGNLAAGGRGEGVALSARDREICALTGPVLRDMGIMFAGIDVIGDYLTEINVTSPTCIRELDSIYGLDIAGQLMESIRARMQAGA